MKKRIIFTASLCFGFFCAWADNITFADENAKAICVANWDTNNDGELNYEEAAAVADLGEVFKGNTEIMSFNELLYFTGLTEIPREAFMGCSNLTSLVIPDNITQIGYSAFDDCYALSSVNLPSTITFIDGAAFSDCRSLTSITLPEGIPSLGDWFFDNCTGLTEIVIPNSVTSIGQSAFSGCRNLTNVILPEGLTILGANAFDGCQSLSSIILPSTVTTIGCMALRGTSITSLTIPASVTNLKEGSYDNVEEGDGGIVEECSSLTEINVEEGNPYYYSSDNVVFTEREDIAGEGGKALVLFPPGIGGSYEVPSDVTYICPRAFVSCNKLTNIILSDRLTEIGHTAFWGCSALTSITIPEGVTNIGHRAFYGCNFTTVTVKNSIPISIEVGTFTCYNRATLYVPYGSKVAYETSSYWSSFKEIVELGEESSQTILPWGADEPWQMKYIQQPSEFYSDPVSDSSGLEWTQLSYDDSQWETLTGPMANGETLVVDIFNYTWDGENQDFNLRRTFMLDEVNPDGYTFAVLHDDDVKVYVNGTLATEMSGATDWIRTAKLEASLFREGDNQLSIFYHGGPYSYNYLDYALFAGNNYHAGNHYNSDLAIPREISIDHIVYSINGELTEAICQGWDWSDGYQPTEGPNIRTTITINGKDYPVTSIGYYAFMNIDQHWDITVPEGIKYLQGYAFWDSNDIGHISLPSTLLGMGFSSAIPCNIESISVAEGNPVYDSRDNCNAVIETATNTAVVVCDINTLPISVTTLGGYCMTGNRGEGCAIDVFTIPDHIVSTGPAFIPNGEYINTLNIPNSLTEIIAPMTLPVPKTVNIAADNPKYYTVGNCILEKGTDVLVDTWENSQIPDYITSFGYNSLYHYTGDVTLRERNPKQWSYEGEVLGQLSRLIVPRGSIPHYLYQGWTNSPFKIITDGKQSYYNRVDGDTWYAPHIDCMNLPSTTAGEDVTLSVLLSADQPVTAFQFDLYLPDGMSITEGDVQLSLARTCANNHSITTQQLSDGGWHIECSSSNDSHFTGNEGEVCTIRVKTSECLANNGAPIVFKNVRTTYLNRIGDKEYSEREQLTSYVNFFSPKMPSSDANKLSVSLPSALRIGDNASMSLNLTNENEIIMTEFYLQLPEGISIANDEEGYPDVTINSNRENDHSLEVVLGSDGLYHFMCYSSKNNALNGNDGELFHLNLVVDENMTPDTYQGIIKGILMSDADRNELTQANYTFDIVVMDVEMGDANGDGRINGLDVVDIVDYILGRPSDSFIFSASDLTGDGKVNGMDLVKMVALVMSQSAQYAPARNFAPAKGHKSSELSVQLLSLSATQLLLGVSSSDEFILTQFLVELSDGTQLIDIETDLAHMASWKAMGNNRYAVLVYSGRNASFTTNDAMVRLNLSGDSSVSVRNMMVVDVDRHEHWLADVGLGCVTGIENLTNNGNSVTRFDLQGRKVVGDAANGVYIINGKKVIK